MRFAEIKLLPLKKTGKPETRTSIAFSPCYAQLFLSK